jgi:O-antigen/teichoic acid export membrane protein
MSIKRNFLYSSILTVSNYLFPLLVFPYVTRTLGPTNLGICNYVDGIINYGLIIAMMGINVLGVRIAARYKNNSKLLNLAFSSLLVISTVSSLIVLVSIFFIVFYIPALSEYKLLLIPGLLKVVFTLFSFDWYFKGIENFKYITYRGIFVKTLYVLSVYLFVKNANDYFIYYYLSIGMLGVNSLIQIVYLKKRVTFQINNRILKKIISPFITLGIYTILTSLYTSFNVIYLGIVAPKNEVGFYTTSIRLFSIFLALFTTFTGVMLPRMSILVAEKNFEKLKEQIAKSYEILFTFCIPIIVLSTFFAPTIIHIIAGDKFNGAVMPMRIIMPLMLIIGMEQITILQILTPLNKDRYILLNSLIGASLGFAFNFILVKDFRSTGSAITLVISEIAVFISAQIMVKNILNINLPFKKIIIHLLFGVGYCIICNLAVFFISIDLLAFALSTIITFIGFAFFNLVIYKNSSLAPLIPHNVFNNRSLLKLLRKNSV